MGWDPQGNIFVSDGYCNNRVVKYDKDGRFLAQAGSEKAGKALGEFNLPHGLQVDGQGNVWVADRSNFRYQVLDNNLKPIREITNLGVGWTVCISPGPSPIRVPVELEPEREHAGNLGHHRRNLQGGTGRNGARQVRSRRQTGSRIPGGSHDGLPQSERDYRGRNRILARAETHS